MKMNKRYISYLMVAVALVVAAACNYKEKDELDGKGLRKIRFQAGVGAYGYHQDIAAFDPIVETGPITTVNRDAISNADLQTTVTATVTVLDSTAVQLLDVNKQIMDATAAEYPEDTPFEPGTDPVDSFFVLPTKFYKLTDGSTLTFGPGEAVKELKIDLDPTLGYDYGKKYVLPVKLSNVSAPYVASSGADFALVQVVVKNAYDGTYSKIGSRFNFNAKSDAVFPAEAVTPTGFAAELPYSYGADPVSTVDANTVTIYAANSEGGFGTVNAHINSDNSVDISANASTALANVEETPGHKSSYDPDTQSFHIVWQYTNANGTFRIIVEDYVYKGPR